MPDTLLETSFVGKDVLSDLWDVPGNVVFDHFRDSRHRTLSRPAGDVQLSNHGFAGMVRGVTHVSLPELLTGTRTLGLGILELGPDTVTGAFATTLCAVKEPIHMLFGPRDERKRPASIGWRPRVTTIVLDEYDRGSDAVGGQIIEWLGMVYTRRHLLKRSDRVVWLIGKDATPDRFRETLKSAAERGSMVDVAVFSHGGMGEILLRRPLSRKAIEALSESAGPALRSVYQMNCHGASLNDAWIKAGADTVHSHRYKNQTHIYFIAKYMRYLSDGETHAAASRKAWRKMAIEIYWTPLYYVDCWLSGVMSRKRILEQGKAVIDGDVEMRIGPLDTQPGEVDSGETVQGYDVQVGGP